MNKLYSLEKLKEIAQGDDAFVREMAITFIDNVSVEITNIQKLIDEGEWKTIGGIVHRLAPNYAYMGAETLYKLAADIEKKIKDDYNLTETTTITRQMCADSLVLIDELKKYFDK